MSTCSLYSWSKDVTLKSRNAYIIVKRWSLNRIFETVDAFDASSSQKIDVQLQNVSEAAAHEDD